MEIPTLDRWINEDQQKVDIEGYLKEVDIAIRNMGLTNTMEKAYAFAVIELWKKASKMNWLKPYADIIALRPYITAIEQIKKDINK